MLVVSGRDPVRAQEQALEVVRYAGGSRAATSADISAKVWQDGADTVLIANGDDFADALSGAPLAARLAAPLLLASRDTLDPTAEEELRRLAPTTAYLLGGTAVLSEDLEEKLADVGVEDVERVAGGDRFATAVAVAEAFQPTEPTAYLVSGENWPDAVSSAFLVAGPERLATSQAVASSATRCNADGRRLWLATAANFPDALAAAPAVARDGGVLQLIDGGQPEFSGTARETVRAWGPEMAAVRLVGGPAAVPADYERQVAGTVKPRPGDVGFHLSRLSPGPTLAFDPLPAAASYRALDIDGLERYAGPSPDIPLPDDNPALLVQALGADGAVLAERDVAGDVGGGGSGTGTAESSASV